MNIKLKLGAMLLLLLVATSFQARVHAAMLWSWQESSRPSTANNCSVSENGADIYAYHNYECPYIRYTATCNFYDGCYDGWDAANEVADWWGTETTHSYLVINFTCDDEQNPTGFTFEVDPVYPFECYILNK